MIVVDVWSLLTVLLITAVLQEFIIKPSVEFLKKYYNKSRKHVEERIFGKENHPIEELMNK